MYNNLRELRKARKISAKEMADALGLKTEAAYYKKESGSIKFSVDEAIVVSKLLGKSVDEIFFGDEVSAIETFDPTTLVSIKEPPDPAA